MLKKPKTSSDNQTQVGCRPPTAFKREARQAMAAPPSAARTEAAPAQQEIRRVRRYAALAHFPAPETSVSPITADLEAVKTVLRRLVKPDAVDRWFNERSPLLDGQTPTEAIRGGEAARVIGVLARLEEGMHL